MTRSLIAVRSDFGALTNVSTPSAGGTYGLGRYEHSTLLVRMGVNGFDLDVELDHLLGRPHNLMGRAVRLSGWSVRC